MLKTVVQITENLLLNDALWSGSQRWTSARQMSYEGGFQGRTNKLVDGCYSFWQGGVFPLLHVVLSKKGKIAHTDLL